LRVVYFNPVGCIGGAERSLLTLLAGLRRHTGIECRLLLAAPGELESEARTLGIESAVLPLPAGLSRLGESGAPAASVIGAAALRLPAVAAYAAQLRRFLSRWEPDVVHTNGLKSHVLGALAVAGPARLVWHLHDYVSARAVTRRLLRASRRRCAIAVGVSESVTRDARAAVPGLTVATVENGVDSRHFTPEGPTADLDALAAAPALEPGTVRVGLVGTYARWKGHDVFFDALARLAHVPLQPYVVGGPLYDTTDSQWQRDDLERMAERAGVRSRVRFVPFSADVAPIMRALDVIVHASTAPEPFGLVIAEAMCTRRAVIVSAAGGAAGLVRPEVDALTYEPGDAPGLAAAIERLVTDASTRTRIAAAGRVAGARRFDSARLAGDMLRVYEHAVTMPASVAAAV